MPKNKLKKFAENETFPHFFQPVFEELCENGFPLKGIWNKEFFKNANPVVLELGCGKGEYCVGLAELEPDRNYIGMDIKGSRMWHGAKTAQLRGWKNLAFIRSKIDQVERFFGPEEISDIWLTFSDPQARDSRAHRRLTHPRFIKMYQRLLKPGGTIHLKTDSPLLYAFTLEVIEEMGLHIIWNSADVYGELIHQVDDLLRKKLQIRTYYEDIWLKEAAKIHYLEFKVHPNG